MGTRIILPIRRQAVDQRPTLLSVASPDALAAEFLNLPYSERTNGVAFFDGAGVRSRGWANLLAGEPAETIVRPDRAEDDPTTARDKGGPVYAGYRRFYPWTFLVNAGCVDGDVGAVDFSGWAGEIIDEDTARAVGSELWAGYYSQGHCLRRDAVDLTPTAGTVTLDRGLGMLLEAVDGFGTFHIPARLEPAMLRDSLVRMQGTVPIGPGGWPISFGPGYAGTGPVPSPWRPNIRSASPTAVASNPAPLPRPGEAYVYAHAGRVEAAFRDIPLQQLTGRPASMRHTGTNAVEALVEREAIFRFSALCFAVRVTDGGAYVTPPDGTGLAWEDGTAVTWSDSTPVRWNG